MGLSIGRSIAQAHGGRLWSTRTTDREPGLVPAAAPQRARLQGARRGRRGLRREVANAARRPAQPSRLAHTRTH
jgi:hypothetical protein